MKKRLMIFLFMIFTFGVLAADVVVSGNFSDYKYYGNSYKQGAELVITPDIENQKGAIWSNKMFDLSKDFELNLEVYMGNKDSGGDGAVFVLKPYEDKYNYIGGLGGNLGYRTGSDKLKNTFGIELDTYYSDIHDKFATDHMAFVTKGEVGISSGGILEVSVGNIEDNKWHPLIVTWEASTETLSYTIKGISGVTGGEITRSYSPSTESLLTILNRGNLAPENQNLAYFGYTACTGGVKNKQAIREITVDGTIPEKEFQLKMSETTSPSRYIANTEIIYNIKLENKGTKTMTNIELSSNSGVSFEGWTEYPSENVWRKAGVTIPVGGSIDIVGKKIASAADVTNGKIISTNNAKAFTDYGDSTLQLEHTDAIENTATYSPLTFQLEEVPYTNSNDGFKVNVDDKGTTDKSDDVITSVQYRYKYKIKNIGGIGLKDITLKNAKDETVSINVPGTVAPGANQEFEYLYTLSSEEETANSILNSIKIKAFASDNSESLEKDLKFSTVYQQSLDTIEASVSTLIDSDASKTKISAVGENIKYTLNLKNLKDKILNQIEGYIIKKVDFDNLAAANQNFDGVKASTAKLSGISSFSPGNISKDQTSVATLTYAVTQGDVDEGAMDVIIYFKANDGTTDYTSRLTNEILIDETVLTKDANVTVTPKVYDENDVLISNNKYSKVGHKIKYDFVIENIGKRTATEVKLIDPKSTTGAEIDLGISSLAPGASQSVSEAYTHIVTDADLNLGEVNTEFLIRGKIGSSSEVAKVAPSSVLADITDDFSLKLIVEEGNNFTNEGTVIKYHYEIENKGNRDLNGLTLSDTITASNSVTLNKTSISPGEKVTSSTLSHTLTSAEFTRGNVLIEGEATALKLSGDRLTKVLRETINGFDFTNLNLTITSPTANITYGTLVEYVISIQNTNTTIDAVDVNLIDEISEIKNQNSEKVFENIQINSVEVGGTSVSYTGDINSLKLTVPKASTAEIKVQGNIKANSAITLSSGELIKNKVKLSNKKESEVSIPVVSPTLQVITDVTTANSDKIIEVGEGVTYIIEISNSSSLDSSNVTVIDKITDIKNSQNELVFFRPLSTDRIRVVDKATSASIPFTYSAADGRIVISRIETGKTAYVEIKPTVKSNISFRNKEVITNTFSVNGSSYSHTLTALEGVVQGLEINANSGTILSNNKITLDEEFSYNIEVKNVNTNLILTDVKIETDIMDLKNALNQLAFKDIVISRIYDKATGISKTPVRTTLLRSATPTWPTAFDTAGRIVIPEILPQETLVVEVKAKTNDVTKFSPNENIKIDSKVFIGSSTLAKLNRLDVFVSVPELTVEKTVDRAKVAMGENVTYTIKISNNSGTIAKNVEILDDVLKIEGNTASNLKENVFISWDWTVDSAHSSLKPNSNSPLNIRSTDNLNIADGETITFTLNALTNRNIIDSSFGNTVSVTEGLTKVKKEATATSTVNREGVVISIKSNKTEVKKGKFIKYTLDIFNSNGIQMNDIKIVDILPLGFEYVNGSALISGNTMVKAEIKPTGNNVITFDKLNNANLNIKPMERLEITYILKVGIGVLEGKAVNTAKVESFTNELISNIATYEVNVINDPLFETGSIIGKVFNDIDEDGYQDFALAKKVEISINNENLDEIKLIKGKDEYIVDSEFILRELKSGEKVIVEIRNNSKELSEVNIKTSNGTNLTLSPQGEIATKHKKDKKYGMSGEKIEIKRTKIKNIEKLEIINVGKNEEGIPGARLFTIDGLVIETDRYGRYHVPVLKGEKTNNYLIKLDLDSLPLGTYITTENPKVMRRTKTISKFNFGVVVPNVTLSGKAGEK